MFNTDEFHHNAKHKIFSSTFDHLEDFNISFTENSMHKKLELKSARTGNVSIWEVDSIYYRRNGRPKNLRLIPTKETITEFPGLKGYQMLVYYDGYTGREQNLA